ncbi:uncharacterized protein LOC135716259 [Ochlerotatus camptorhynchus]|uniref:uncharacterized protein LOC135716259 n=1 Tax=Ochlerotatus camptorhynchus TaxID=644619 RepID=UPI0031D4AE59
MWHLKYLSIFIAILVIINESDAQFKILGITSGRSNSDGGELALVQIKPLQLNETEVVEPRSFKEARISTISPIDITTSTTDRSTTVETQTSKIIKLQIMDSSEARNISTRERKLQYENHRTDNIINISPLKPVSLHGGPSSSHRRRATGSIKLTGESDLFYIQKPSSPAPFKKHHQPKENDVISDFVIQRYKRRKYKSKCRCERIWNCPRIQISIARCAPDYFMCCF